MGIKRYAKKATYKKNPDAYRFLIRSIEDFKYLHRFSPFVSWTNTQKQLKHNLGTLKKMVSVLEDFRTEVVAVSDDPFYKFASEFIRRSDNRQYIPIKSIFSEGETSERFVTRIQLVLSWCCDLISISNIDAINDVALFQREVNNLGTKLDARAEFRSKDWYCLASLLNLGTKKWGRKFLLERLKKYYSHANRKKKATPEMALLDMIEGKLNFLLEPKPVKEKKLSKKEKKKEEVEQAVDREEFYKDWTSQMLKAGQYWVEEQKKIKERKEAS